MTPSVRSVALEWLTRVLTERKGSLPIWRCVSATGIADFSVRARAGRAMAS
jgi:hypothetical protein